MVAITTCPTRPAPRSAPRPARLHAAAPAQPAVTGGVPRVVGVALLVLVVAVAVLYLVRTPAPHASGGVPVGDAVHVVAEGETMWSIAGEVAPAGEAGAYVERLVAANGTSAPAPGQVLELPVP